MQHTSRIFKQHKGLLGFTLGVATVAALTFTALASATAKPNMGKGFKKYGCFDVCVDRLYYCLLRSGGNNMPCYYSYTLCQSGCNSGARVGAAGTADSVETADSAP